MRELAPYPDLFPCKNACHVAKVRHSFDGTHKSSAKIGMLGAAMRALCVFRNKARFAPAGKADGALCTPSKYVRRVGHSNVSTISNSIVGKGDLEGLCMCLIVIFI